MSLDELVATLIARQYLRVSKDASGLLRSNAEQAAENERDIAREGWTLGETYEDEGSASRYQSKRRRDFDRLIADLEADTFDAHVLVMWEASRGTRKISEMARLLELCEERGVSVYVTTHHRLYDPTVVRDWRTLMDEALDAETEVRRTSGRVKRSTLEDAKQGRYGGGRRPFGYKVAQIPDARGNRLAIDPEEAAVVRELVRRVLAGATVRSLAAELNKRGIPTSAGNSWAPGPLSQMLRAPRLAGLRVHEGVVVGPALWEPIIDEATHRRLVAVMASRTPVGRRGRTPWLLTGLLRCERCGANLVGQTSTTGTRRYVCKKAVGYRGCGGLVIKAEPLEACLGTLATERLADVEARRNAGGSGDDELELARLDEIAADRADLAELRFGGDRATRITNEDYVQALAVLDRAQREAEAAIAAKSRDTAPLDFVLTEGFVGEPFDGMSADRQRLLLDALIESVTVAPASLIGSNLFEKPRVTAGQRIAWKI